MKERGFQIVLWLVQTVLLALIPLAAVFAVKWILYDQSLKAVLEGPEIILLALALSITGIVDCVEALRLKTIGRLRSA